LFPERALRQGPAGLHPHLALPHKAKDIKAGANQHQQREGDNEFAIIQIKFQDGFFRRRSMAPSFLGLLFQESD